MTSTDFRAAARAQAVCAVCQHAGAFDPHHVVARRHLRKLGQDIWDPRNALRLCPACHARHENAFRRVQLAQLTDENVAYTLQLLGPRAVDYLHRHYSGPDPRVPA